MPAPIDRVPVPQKYMQNPILKAWFMEGVTDAFNGTAIVKRENFRQDAQAYEAYENGYLTAKSALRPDKK